MSIRFWFAMFSRLQRFLVAQIVGFYLLMSVGGAANEDQCGWVLWDE